MRRLPFITLLCVTALLLASCDQKTFEPPTSDPVWTTIGQYGGASFPASIWGSAPDDIYVGHLNLDDDRALSHFDGTTWRFFSVGQSGYIQRLWGSSSNDVYAVTSRGLWHFDGNHWTDTGLDARDVSGSSSSDVVAITAQHTLLHFDGAQWDTLLTTTGNGWMDQVWVDGSTVIVDIYNGNGRDSLMHFENGSWLPLEAAPGRISELVFAADNDIVAVGADSVGAMAWRDTGSGWTPMMTSGQYDYLYDVAWIDANDAYASADHGALLHFDGTSWQQALSFAPGYVEDLWASSSTDLYVLGDEVRHFDGNTWTSPVPQEPQQPISLWADSQGRIVVGGFKSVYRFENGVWSEQGRNVLGTDVEALAGLAADNLYAATDNGIYHYDGVAWTAVPDSPGYIDRMSVAPTGELFVTNGLRVHRFDAHGWTEIKSVNVINGDEALLALAVDNVLFGYADGILQFNGTSWKKLYDDTCGDLWAASEHDIYGVGWTVILHSDGGRFEVVGPRVPGGVERIAGASANHVMAIGIYGYALLRDEVWVAGENERPSNVLGLVSTGEGSLILLEASSDHSFRLSRHRAE